LRCRSH